MDWLCYESIVAACYVPPKVCKNSRKKRQIKADLQEKDIKVSMPLWGDYKIIDEKGVEHSIETLSDLPEYYKKVMNK